MSLLFAVFFFKQKTEYGLLISDWSADVCSSDLLHDEPERHDVGKLLEADVPFGHLLPDRIRMLLAAGNLGLDAVTAEQQPQPRSDPRNLAIGRASCRARECE